MILLKIFDIKSTMADLLLKEEFDQFYLEEAKVVTFAKLELSGIRNMNFYDSAEKETGLSERICWKEAKPVIYSYIKGKKTPSSFRITLRAPESIAAGILEKGGRQGMAEYLLHFRFESEELSVVTGCSYHAFTMEKAEEFAWDQAVKEYFKRRKISFEEA